jgi:hypothetical protein
MTHVESQCSEYDFGEARYYKDAVSESKQESVEGPSILGFETKSRQKLQLARFSFSQPRPYCPI